MNMTLINEIATAGRNKPVTVVDFGDVVTALHIHGKQEAADEIHGRLQVLMTHLAKVAKKAAELGLERKEWDWLCQNAQALAQKHGSNQDVLLMAAAHDDLVHLCHASRVDTQLGGMALNATAQVIEGQSTAR